MPLPGWLVLIAVGTLVLLAAYYLPAPPEVKMVGKFIGIALLLFGALLFLVVMLAAAGIGLPG